MSDGMSPRKKRGGGASSPQVASGDSFGALPDYVLHHVLSFLPAEDAVRTCVLARRWRHLWKSATSLHIVRRDLYGPESVKAVRKFVDHLLLLRGGSPLDSCELRLADFDFDDDDISRLNLWIRHILMCKVRVLSLDILRAHDNVMLDGLTLISDHLKKLQLSNIQFENELLDFSCCPSLEVLEIDESDLSFADRISSHSLKCLSIVGLCFFDTTSRTRIYAPNLHSLRLTISCGRTPMLDGMPSLVEAFVKLSYCLDKLYGGNSDRCDSSPYSGNCEKDDCSGCYKIHDDTKNCVLLQGLSQARHLSLKSDIKIFIFRRDLEWCPIFGNLRTLSLNEYWCVPADFSALACMLEHSPILEKLTLQLFCKGPKSKFEMKGMFNPTKRSAAMSEHLKIVEVRCEVVDDRVRNVLRFLGELGVDTYQFSF